MAKKTDSSNCKACETRRKKMEGQCPSCANERAKSPRKYDNYQWQFSDGRNKRLSDMTEDELREALALSLDLYESMSRLTDKMTDRLSLFAAGRYADDQED